jgi:hypothetical protein
LQILAESAVADLSFQVSGGALPSGLTLHQDGVIAGFPSAVSLVGQPFRLEITATHTPSGLSSAVSVSLTINNSEPVAC